ncbi:GNAT family N-acetyltransferase [Streptomyces sp. NBS 14/10]|uniref:GNAT family N-acetyltransferase n=1 Tax=Streptomyces sp. NBS 14/10 TaxID=1945643 RepID=UPI000B9D3587|nr:GNAT family N-acetyltransferase [Streptomyces sp. NBS 14/10]KAK1181796.1 GNAT family N-acetyltransferase [Streptomyces sp. NBS 14/10]
MPPSGAAPFVTFPHPRLSAPLNRPASNRAGSSRSGYSSSRPAAGSSHSLFLKELYVRDTLRRQGVGAQLMKELQALGAARPGCSRVEWITDRDNPQARDFCKSLGFAE